MRLSYEPEAIMYAGECGESLVEAFVKQEPFELSGQPFSTGVPSAV